MKRFEIWVSINGNDRREECRDTLKAAKAAASHLKSFYLKKSPTAKINSRVFDMTKADNDHPGGKVVFVA